MIMARTSKSLQEKDICIRGVERCIMTLCQRLQSDYNTELLIPRELTGDGEADNILCELFGENLDDTLVNHTTH